MKKKNTPVWRFKNVSSLVSGRYEVSHLSFLFHNSLQLLLSQKMLHTYCIHHAVWHSGVYKSCIYAVVLLKSDNADRLKTDFVDAFVIFWSTGFRGRYSTKFKVKIDYFVMSLCLKTRHDGQII